MRVGVLALQGAFREHIEMLRRMGHETVEVRLPEHLNNLDALILPGGESTTMGKLLDAFKLRQPLRAFAHSGRPTWGTCAGLILLAHDVGRPQPLLDLMDLRVARNAFGRQVESFETDLDIPALGAPAFPAVFIRAPVIESVGAGVEALARLPDGRIVAARQGNLLGSSFHPELTSDPRLHAYFLSLARGEAPASQWEVAARVGQS